MAYDFDGVDDYIEATTAVLTGAPITMACWFNSDSASAIQILMSLSDSASANRLALEANGSVAGDPVRVRANTVNAATATGYTVGTWHHAAGVFASTSSRTAYIDGVAGTANTNSLTPAGINTTNIGCWNQSGSRGSFTNGRIAEAAIWDVALNADEIMALADGFRPSLIRPASLRLYVPLVREVADYARGLSLTTSGAIVAEHPRRIA